MRPSDPATTHLAGPRTLGIPKIRLKVLKGPDKGTTVTLEQDEILIGGADGAHLRLTDPTVSRNHCVIRLTAKGPLLRDLGSTNGTRIEGVDVREGYVPAGATLALGHTQVRFEPLDESVQIPLADSERFGRLMGAVDGDAPPVRRRGSRRGLRRHGADPGRDRHRQGRAGRGDPPGEHARRRTAGRRRLRRRPPQPDRDRAVRPREGRVHRRRPRARRRVRGGRRRHAVPRRDRRAAARPAAQAAARARGARAAPRRRRAAAQGRRARHRRHQPRPARGGQPRRVPPGPLLPPRGRAPAGAAAARAPRGHPGAGGALPPARQARRRRRPAVRRSAAPTSWRIRGRATCASCATPSNA